jgi:hypothetical protein
MRREAHQEGRHQPLGGAQHRPQLAATDRSGKMGEARDRQHRQDRERDRQQIGAALIQLEAERSEQGQRRDHGAGTDGGERDEALQIGRRDGGAHRHATRLQHDGACQALTDDVEQELAREVAERERVGRVAAVERDADGAHRPFEAEVRQHDIRGQQQNGQHHRQRRDLGEARPQPAEIDREDDQDDRDRGGDAGEDGLQPAHRRNWTGWKVIRA